MNEVPSSARRVEVEIAETVSRLFERSGVRTILLLILGWWDFLVGETGRSRKVLLGMVTRSWSEPPSEFESDMVLLLGVR